MDELTLYDKIHLAECAALRSREHHGNEERFLGEFRTAILWKQHRISNYRKSNGELFNFISGY